VRVLVVDDEIKNAELTALELRDAGHDAEFTGASRAALKRLEAESFDAVVTDLRMAPPDGLALLTEIRKRWPATAVVLMTAYSTKETARRALNDGAAGYVDKEGEFRAELRTILERIGRERRLEHDNRALAGTVDSLKKGLATVIGESAAIRKSLELANKVAATDSTVLLRGESGTGKDLFARAIHFSSRRAAGPWIKVNCGALPENLLESELFGHEKGAFTGAVRQKIGRCEDADQGTLFLDEIGELPMALQVKLLQVIEEKTFTRVGGNQPITVDVRIIAATNRDLEEMARSREFREDLFFRLNVFPIRLPSLRERPEDIAALVGYFLAGRGASRDKVGPEAMRALEQYAFPGNVRELENTLERAMILAGSDPIGPEHFSFARPEMLATFAGASGSPPWVPVIPPDGLSLEVLERELILQALDMARGNKSQAARLLGLTRRTLYSRMEKHGLRKPEDGEAPGEESEAGADEAREAGA
jgi:DNA-binding NtrC family response regulator